MSRPQCGITLQHLRHPQESFVHCVIVHCSFAAWPRYGPLLFGILAGMRIIKYPLQK